MTACVVRPMQDDDAPSLARLLAQLGYPCGAAEVAARAASLGPESRVLVAEEDGRVVGLLHLARRATLALDVCLEIVALVVEEERRGRGIGARLLAAAEDLARREGIDRLTLYSNAVRERAHRFYAAQGFVKVKDSVRLAKELPGHNSAE